MARLEELESEVRGMAMDVDQQMSQQIAAAVPEATSQSVLWIVWREV